MAHAQNGMLQFTEINSASMGDWVSVYTQVFNEPPWCDGWSIEAASERLKTFALYPRFLALGMSVNGQKCGFVLGWSERWINDWQFHLYEMCVLPALQRSGHGRRLIGELERRLCERGEPSIFLQTGANLPAGKFYEACGYRERGMVMLGKKIAAN